MRLVFDRGTVLLDGLAGNGLPPAVAEASEEIGGLLWDPRVSAYRAPARLAYPLAARLARRAVQLSDKPHPALSAPAGMRAPELRGYQEEALAAWRLAGRRGLVVLPTGAGKTQVALAAVAGTRTAALCLVPTRALIAQWQRAIARLYDGPIGVLGDGEHRIEPITVATFASAYRHMAQVGDRFGLMVVDEAHHFGRGAYDEALEMSIAPLRLGLTATPPAPGAGRERLELLVGPIAYELSIDDLAGKFLAPFERVTLSLRLAPDEWRTYAELAATYRRGFDSVRGARPELGWDELCRLASLTEEGRRGLAAWRRARRLLAYPRCKREAVAMLLDRHRHRRTLVFVADNETAYRIAREHLVMPLTCEIGRNERDDVLEAFRAGRLRALVSAQVLNEGLDVPEAEVGIIVGGRLGGREHVQRIGRLLRPAEGKRARVYELVVQGTSEVRQSRKRWEPLAARSRAAAAVG